MPEENGNSRIGYTVKELLAEMKLAVDRIESKLDSKVDTVVVDALIVRIRAVENLNLPAMILSLKETERLIAVNTTKLETLEALRTQERQLGETYLRQWEAMQKDMQEVKTELFNINASQKKSQDWRVLWYPIIALLISNTVLVFVTINGGKL